MSITSLSISGLQEDMTSDEVKQKLAKLYNIPEKHFEELCRSLFITKQPYVLLKKVEQSEADIHVQRLTEIGFDCSSGDGGLSLAPVAETKRPDVICPACEQSAGSGEICQQCGVIMHKFLQQKKIDDQIQSQLSSSNSTDERMQRLHAERTKRHKELEIAKRRNAKAKKLGKDSASESRGNNSDGSRAVDGEIRVDSNKKTSKWMYAAVTSFGFLVIGGGYVLYEFINNRYVNDGFLAASDAQYSTTSAAGLSASQKLASENLASSDQQEQTGFGQQTVFGEQLQRKHELKILKNHIRRLVGEDMLFSATGLISGKEDPRDRLFGNQELIELQGLNLDTGKKLINTLTLAGEMANDVDRIDALLNQSGIYISFGLHEEAAEVYDQAARIAFDIDNLEQRVLAETAIAEHHVEQGDPDGARGRYQIAKDKAKELALPLLSDAGFGYIATSEASYGLTADAKLTGENIVDAGIRESSLQQIDLFKARNKASGTPEHAAAHEQTTTGDPLADSLIEMNEQNKRKIKAANSLLGQ